MNLVIFCDLKYYMFVVNYYDGKTIGLLIYLCNFLIADDMKISLTLIFEKHLIKLTSYISIFSF